VFVALAEEGWTDTPVTVATAERYLLPLFDGADAPDTLVLGCTHFPVLAATIGRVIGEKIAIVDSAETTAAAVAETLGTATERSGGGAMRFFATDSPERFARVGAIFLGRPIAASDVELIDLRSTP
jgi:glutamate racemase